MYHVTPDRLQIIQRLTPAVFDPSNLLPQFFKFILVDALQSTTLQFSINYSQQISLLLHK